jgi:hypothetical protein
VNSGSNKKPQAVVVGFIGKLPYAGMSLYNLHYIDGLESLGYEVHYVERINKAQECYNPETRAATDDPAFAIEYLRGQVSRFSFIDRENRCHGLGWGVLRSTLQEADFVLTLADPTWFDELEICPRRAFVDGDPMFTQIEKMDTLAHYPTLFTYCTRMGQPDCAVPQMGRDWIATRPVVSTSRWNVTQGNRSAPVTGLMHWASGSDITSGGRTYGHKNREFERFLDLPRRTSHPFVLALGGSRAPRELIREHGWQLVNPLEMTGTIPAYREFIHGSCADFGVAKHAYVASRCGWFSDRSTCFLAAGRPVLHQDTGCGDWLPTGSGALLFSDVESAVDVLRRVEMDYDCQARAARSLAEEYFEASTVINHMLEEAGFR